MSEIEKRGIFSAAKQRPTELPEIQDLKDGDHFLDGRSLFIQGTHDVSLVNVGEQGKDIFEKKRGLFSRNQRLALGGGYAVLIGQNALVYGDIANQTIGRTIVAVSTGIIVSAASRAYCNGVQRIRGRRRSKQKIQSSPDTIRLANHEVNFTLPRSILDTEVSFVSEEGLSYTSASKLVKSAQGFFGVNITEETDTVHGSIHPWHMVRDSLNLFDSRESRDAAYPDIIQTLSNVSEAVRRLPPNGLDESSPNSMKRTHTRDMQQLVLGALTTFATVRSAYAPRLAERINTFYAAYDGEVDPEVLENALALDQPAVHNCTWKFIESFLKAVPKQRAV